MPQRKALLLLCLLVCASGFSCIVYEITWQRILTKFIGPTLPAVSVIFATFMSGMGIGSFFYKRISHKFVGREFILFALVESLIGVCGVLSATVFSDFQIGLQIAQLGDYLRIGFLVLLLLPPSILFGVALPLMVDTRHDDANANYVRILYASNLIGAVLASFITCFVLLPRVGLTRAILCAVASNFVAASIALLMQKSAARLAHSPNSDAPNEAGDKLGLLLVFLTGFLSLSLEVVFSRFFSLVVGGSTIAISAVLGFSLIGTAIGSIFSNWVSKFNQKLMLSICFSAASIFLLLELYFADQLPWYLYNLHRYFVYALPSSTYLLERMILMAPIVIPLFACLGAVFPLSVPQRNSNYLSTALLLNGLGGAVGSIFTGFWFIPVFSKISFSGMQGLMLLCSLICMFTVALLISQIFIARRVIVLPIVGGLLTVLFFCKPFWDPEMMTSGISFVLLPENLSKKQFESIFHSPQDRIIFYAEGLNTTVTVNQNENTNISYLKTDGKVEAALPIMLDKHSVGSDLVTQSLLGQLPSVMHTGPLRKVLVCGLGSGAACGAALSNREVEHLSVIEIEPSVVDAMHCFDRSNGNPLSANNLSSGRVSLIIDDARSALARVTEPLDAVISQPSEPWLNGASNLYSKEFWSLARTKLAEKGVFCQWIQLYACDKTSLYLMLNTFQDVFPESFVFYFPGAGEILVLGSKSEVSLTEAQAKSGPLPRSFGSLLLLTPERLKQLCLSARRSNISENEVTDDNLALSFRMPKFVYDSDKLIQPNLDWLSSH